MCIRDREWFGRYIDDALCRIPKNAAQVKVNTLHTILNSMDQNIKWTTDFQRPTQTTVFLDLEINNSSGTYAQHFKKTAKIDGYVPYDSQHQRHTLNNVPRNLFNRAATLNGDHTSTKAAFNHLQTGLIALKYPIKLTTAARNAATHITPVRSKNIPAIPKQTTLYLTLTNNMLNSKNPLYNNIAHLNHILHMDSENILTQCTVKLSMRQPPSVAARNNILSTQLLDQHGPTKCFKPKCKTCKHILLESTWTDNSNYTHKIANFSCKSRNLIYILIEPSNNTVLYVGHTGQTIGTRMNQHRVGKSCIRNNSTSVSYTHLTLPTIYSV